MSLALVLLALGQVGAASLHPEQTLAPSIEFLEKRAEITAVTDCQVSSSSLYCTASSTEFFVQTSITATTGYPAQFTGCHSHGEGNTYCVTNDGEVAIIPSSDIESGDADPDERHCHFHAGVEHCIGGEMSCERVDRDYDIGSRIGFLFGTLATSALGSFSPIVLAKFFPAHDNIGVAFLNQFGTGVIISTAFVHLWTHGELMFASECLEPLGYEAMTGALVMAGLFVSFLLEFVVGRLLRRRLMQQASASNEQETSVALQTKVDTTNVTIMEAGIVFHSILIGVTTVVAGDSYYATLATVILFHQFFEGIALGTRIAALGFPYISKTVSIPAMDTDRPHHNNIREPLVDRSQPSTVPLTKKLIMALIFSLTTPLGMAIGIGVLQTFNGNDPTTIIVIGTFDAVSAGILIWIGVAEMLASDWIYDGPMGNTGLLKTCVALFGLVAGMALMSFLGRWA